MDFSERFSLYLESGMITEDDVATINRIIELFSEKYGIILTEENAAAFIAHLCMIYFRTSTGEEVEPLPDEIFQQLSDLDTYDQSKAILDDILEFSQINDIERGYMLLHINNLLQMLEATE